MLELMLDLLDRAARGFLFALPVAALWFSALGFQTHGRTTQHIGLSLVFLLYLSGVLAVTGIGRPFGFFPRLALVPFVDMIKGPVDTTLNVLLFCRWACSCRFCTPSLMESGKLRSVRLRCRLPLS